MLMLRLDMQMALLGLNSFLLLCQGSLVLQVTY